MEKRHLRNTRRKILNRKTNMKYEHAGIEVEIEKSELDGTLIVFIDTPDISENENGPKIRVYLNSEAVFDNPNYDEVRKLKELE